MVIGRTDERQNSAAPLGNQCRGFVWRLFAEPIWASGYAPQHIGRTHDRNRTEIPLPDRVLLASKGPSTHGGQALLPQLFLPAQAVTFTPPLAFSSATTFAPAVLAAVCAALDVVVSRCTVAAAALACSSLASRAAALAAAASAVCAAASSVARAEELLADPEDLAGGGGGGAEVAELMLVILRPY